MLAVYTLFALLMMRLGRVSSERFELRLYDYQREFHTREYVQFDGLTYCVYRPKKGHLLVSVTDGKKELWSGSCDQDFAKLAVLTYGKGAPRLLFLRTELYNERDFFFKRVERDWVRTGFEEYLKLSRTMRESKGELVPFVMNLALKDAEFVRLTPTSDTRRFETFTVKPKNGDKQRVATSVYHGVFNLWTAEKEGERVLAAWAYKSGPNHYLVRLLVRNADFAFRFYNFLRVGNVFLDMENPPFNFLKSDDSKFPEDFYFPEYFLSKPSPTLFGASKRKSLTSLSDFVDPSFTFKPESKPSDHDFRFHKVPIPPKVCSRLDFSKRMPRSLGHKVASVLDGSYPVTSYYPKVGTFFGLVRDGTQVIFDRNMDMEACVGAHFYTRAGKHYLADVLVYSPEKPRSEYHVKQDGKWTPINKELFLQLLSELKK